MYERKKKEKEGKRENGKEIEKGENVQYLSLEFNIIKVDMRNSIFGFAYVIISNIKPKRNLI